MFAHSHQKEQHSAVSNQHSAAKYPFDYDLENRFEKNGSLSAEPERECNFLEAQAQAKLDLTRNACGIEGQGNISWNSEVPGLKTFQVVRAIE
jgi:hypothetical protein